MSFNPDPNKQAIEVLSSHKINSPKHHPLYYLNNQEVWVLLIIKNLALSYDSKLTFAKHISQKISIAGKLIGIIKYMSYAPIKAPEQIYKIFV